MADHLKPEVVVLKVSQWLNNWDTVKFDGPKVKENRKKPQAYFLLFTIKAKLLKRLSKVYPRRADQKRDLEIGVQRKHDPERSAEINRYIKLGYPLSDYAKGDKIPDQLLDLQMPGWLPTAIVANILKKGTKRGNHQIKDTDLIEIKEKNGITKLILPNDVTNPKWDPFVPPIEIIDGQHRLWAFNSDDKISNEFELPVVAFFDLDITWQAYLFYTINVKPKKINRSLAYDLYPLLRIQEWLERAPDTAYVYKETRAQEIVEILWSYQGSPWKDKINMIGDTRKTIEAGKSIPNITQAAFIRNLIASFIKTSTTKGLGGLFGAKLTDEYNSPLSWNRTQQSSFIIFIWQGMYDAISNSKDQWAISLRGPRTKQLALLHEPEETPYSDRAFNSVYSLISTDQGVRGFQHVINDFVYTKSESLGLRDIRWSGNTEEIKTDRIDPSEIDRCLKDLNKSKLKEFTKRICDELVKFDWRTSSEPNLDADQRKSQMIFKGSSGYKELREQLLLLLAKSKNNDIKETANHIIKELGYAR